MNYCNFLNSATLRRNSLIKNLKNVANNMNMIYFNKNLPSSLLFPFKSFDFKLRDDSILKIDESQTISALQASHPLGNPELRNFLSKFQTHFHKPPLSFDCNPSVFNKESNNVFDICITSGSGEGLCNVFEMLIDDGDYILVEEPTYPGVLYALKPLNGKIIPIKTDHNGIKPDILEDILKRYYKNKSVKRIKFLYTIPNGTNPTGATTSLERKLYIYQLAKKYNFLVIEDDPYYFLQFEKPRIPSYLSLDEDGRVLRFDSFSKILSSGLRVGFITAPKPLTTSLSKHHFLHTLHPSHLSQTIILELLKKWELQGFENHVDKVVNFYKSQKNIIMKLADKYLRDLAEWEEPMAGMFLWIKLHCIPDTKKLIEEKAQKKKVLLVPGCHFYPNDKRCCPYVRASFSLSSEQNIDEGFRRLTELIKEEIICNP